jgi:hypothetical protein
MEDTKTVLIRKITALTSALIVSIFAFFALASAQEDQAGGAGSGLLISPTRTEINAQPGEKKEFTITIRNVTQGDVTARAFINDFESDGTSGTPRFIVDEGERTPSSIFNMVKGLSDIDLKKDESKEVKLSLEVDTSIPAGAYFGAVRYAAIPKGQNLDTESERQVALTASVAHLVFLEIAGDTVEQIQIEDLYMQRDNSRSSIFFRAPNNAALAIKNLGNGFSRPFGNVTINDFLGNEVAKYEPNSTDPKGIVLPNSSRTFINDIENIKTPGRYTATAAVAYGNGGEVVTYKSSFWYLPAWFLLAVLLVIALIVGGGYYFYKKKYAPTKSSKRKSKR